MALSYGGHISNLSSNSIGARIPDEDEKNSMTMCGNPKGKLGDFHARHPHDPFFKYFTNWCPWFGAGGKLEHLYGTHMKHWPTISIHQPCSKTIPNKKARNSARIMAASAPKTCVNSTKNYVVLRISASLMSRGFY